MDNDCNGLVDDNAADEGTWYADADFDTYGDFAITAFSCDRPFGFVSNADDCDDTDAGVNPAAIEICDSLDNDCDPTTLNGIGDPLVRLLVGVPCDGLDNDLCLEGVFQCVAEGLICSDSTGDDLEICDGVYNDCNGVTDEGLVCVP